MEKLLGTEVQKWLDGNRFAITQEDIKETTRILTSGNPIYTDKRGTIYDEESAKKAWIALTELNKI